MEFITATEAGIKWHLSKRRVLVLCVQNRIFGSIRLGHMWAIPKTAEKPSDFRYKKNRVAKNE